MSFQDLGSLERNGGSGAPMPLRRPRSNPRSSSLSNASPMKKNGSESSTASMSTGSAYGEEDPIMSTAGAGTRRGSSNVSGSLSGTVSSLSGSIVTYQKLVSDYEVLLRSNSRSYAHERKSKALLDEIHQLESEISRQLNALDAATGGRSGPFDGGEELARVKVSHSKLARDFERIKASHDGNMRRTSSTGFGGGVGSSGDAGGSSSTWVRDEAPLGSAATHGNDQQAQLVMQREEEYSQHVMKSREEDIQQINQKMNKVNEIYKDLGNLVSSQQDQIDEIEDAVADSNQNAEYGLDQLERANRPWFGGRGGGGGGGGDGKDKNGEGKAAAAGGNGTAPSEEDKTWGDTWAESYAEFQRDMQEIGNDIAAKGKYLQMCFCGAFGGAVVDNTLS